MPNPDEELEERLARLKGVDVDQVRHPGKGLANDPLETSQDDSLLLHDHIHEPREDMLSKKF